MVDFSKEELERYARHIILDGVGIRGQDRIKSAKVLIIGAGGLGSPVAMYLAAAGVGEIGVVDGDVVELSNLQRQIIHTTADIGVLKCKSAKEKLEAINPNIKIESFNTFVEASNILSLVERYDFVVDGTDNFDAKFLINDACILANKPYSHGGILRFSGQCMTIKPKESACYACLFDTPPPKDQIPTCGSAGVLGAIAGMLGTIQATEALKYITEVAEPLYNTLLTFDAMSMNFRKIGLKKNPNCRVCGKNGIKELVDYTQSTFCKR